MYQLSTSLQYCKIGSQYYFLPLPPTKYEFLSLFSKMYKINSCKSQPVQPASKTTLILNEHFLQIYQKFRSTFRQKSVLSIMALIKILLVLVLRGMILLLIYLFRE